MRAADLTRDDIGAEIEFPFGDITVYGRLAGIKHVIGMVNLTLTSDGLEIPLMMERDRNITTTYEHARFRALTETDVELRGLWLHEANHLAVVGRVEDILRGDS